MLLSRGLLAGFIMFSNIALGDAYDLPKIVAVQDRAYLVHKEISPYVGTLPLDAFNKSVLGGVSYTYSFKPQWSWEVLNAAYAMNIGTNLKSDLLNNFNAQPKGVLDHPQGLFTTELLYSPMYGKFLMFNDKVVHNEMSLGLTAGVINYQSAGAVPAFGPGFTSRFFLDQDSSIKVDARLLYQLTQTQSSNFVLYLTIGYSIHLDSKTGGGT